MTPRLDLPLQVLEHLLEGCQVIGRDYRYLYVNPVAASHGRTTADALLGRTMPEVYPGIERTVMFTILRRCLEDRSPATMENEFVFPDGEKRWFELRFEPVPEGVVILSVEITARKAAEAREAHLLAVLRAIRNVNQLIVQEKDRAELLRKACRILTETRGYRSAWIGLRDEAGRLHVAGESGVGAGLDALVSQLERGEIPPCCRLAAGRGAVALRDPDASCVGCALAGAHPDTAGLAAAIRHGEKDYGVLVVALPRTRAEDREEHELFEEVASDLGLALRSLEQEEARRRASESLKASEERFRAVVEQSPEAIFIQTRGCFAYLNPAARVLFGATEAEPLVGRPVIELFHPDVRAMVASRIRRLNERRESQAPLTERVRRLDGSEVDAELSGVPFLHEGEQGALVFARDVSERLRAEQALERSRALLESIIEQSPNPIWLSDEKGTLIRINRACCELLRIAPEEVIGKYNVLADNVVEAQGAMPLVRAVYAEGRAANFDLSYDTAKLEGVPLTRSARVDLNVTIFPIRDQAGAVTHAAIMHVDVTERRRAEEALRESEARYRLVSENGSDVIWLYDLAAQRFTYVSPSVERLRGFSLEEIGQQSMEQALTPESYRRVAELLPARLAAFAAGDEAARIQTHEVEQPCKDGSVIPTEVVTTLITDAAGQVTHLQGVTRDLSERRRAAAERAALEAQLLESQKLESIGRLAGGVAHDFNNLLSVILGTAALIADDLREADPLREDIEEIQRAAERAATLTRQLLAFSRKQILQPEALRVNDVVAQTESMLRRLLGEDIVLETRLAEGLGSALADRGQLEQVIMNLAVNARDAMPGGGRLTLETAEVELDDAYAAQHVAAQPGRYIALAVSDTGCGMDAETKAHIFEPFFTTKARGKGTGLGLSTVYGIVKQSGGYVWVYSEPGTGTTFKIYLPRVEAPASEPRRRSAQAVASGSETLLLVEDEDAVRRLAERILLGAGYRVLTATNGGDALLLCETHVGPIDLLLTDVVMPLMSGRSLAERLASLRPRLKVLYMSGYTDDAIAHHGVLAPGTRFLSKPFTAVELAGKVREALDE